MLPFSELWLADRVRKIVEKPMQTHFGDPCIHCGIGHDDVPIGACQGDPAKAKPIAYKSLGVRWDKVEHLLIRMSDGRVEHHWEHTGTGIPYVRNLRYDDKIQSVII